MLIGHQVLKGSSLSVSLNFFFSRFPLSLIYRIPETLGTPALRSFIISLNELKNSRPVVSPPFLFSFMPPVKGI